MPKKKQPEKVSNKIVYIFFLVGLIVLLLLGFLYYQSQRPNYRDLEKAFNELTVPEGWQEVSSSSNQGTLGLFCWQIEGEACPYKIVNYSRNQDSLQGIVDQLGTVQNQMSNLGYTDISINLDRCNEVLIKSSDFNCNITSTKGAVEVYYEINGKSPQGQAGNYASVVITRKE